VASNDHLHVQNLLDTECAMAPGQKRKGEHNANGRGIPIRSHTKVEAWHRT
jgi:hypothetical protein